MELRHYGNSFKYLVIRYTVKQLFNYEFTIEKWTTNKGFV